MYKYSINDHYREIIKQIGGEILRMSENDFKDKKDEETIQNFLKRYAFNKIEIKEDGISTNVIDYVRRVPASEREEFYSQSGDLDFVCKRVDISILIKPNPKISEITSLLSSTRSMSYSEDEFSWTNDKIDFSVPVKDYGLSSKNDDEIAKEIENRIEIVKEIIQRKNKDIEIENENLIKEIVRLINLRKKEIEENKEKNKNLSERLNKVINKEDVKE